MVKPGSIIDKEAYLKNSKWAKKKAKSCNKSKQTKLWNIQSKRQNEKKGSTYRILKFTVTFILHNFTGFEKGRFTHFKKAYQGAHLRKHKSFHNLYCHFHPTVRMGQVFASSRRRIGTCLRRPSISTEKRDTVKWFLQMARYQLLQTWLKENVKHDFEISYHTVH